MRPCRSSLLALLLLSSAACGGGGSSSKPWSRDAERTVSVLCGTGSGGTLGSLALVLGSDGVVSMAVQFQDIPWTIEMKRTGDTVFGTALGYTFTGTIASSGKSVSGSVIDGSAMTTATWTAGVDGCSSQRGPARHRATGRAPASSSTRRRTSSAAGSARIRATPLPRPER